MWKTNDSGADIYKINDAKNKFIKKNEECKKQINLVQIQIISKFFFVNFFFKENEIGAPPNFLRVKFGMETQMETEREGSPLWKKNFLGEFFF